MFQGLYYFFTGIWPLVSMNSFLTITGPKTDLWLVIVVGLLLAVIGAVLFVSGLRDRTVIEFVLLGTGAAASLAAVDIYFVINKTISPVYLLDAVIEVGFFLLWVVAPNRG